MNPDRQKGFFAWLLTQIKVHSDVMGIMRTEAVVSGLSGAAATFSLLGLGVRDAHPFFSSVARGSTTCGLLYLPRLSPQQLLRQCIIIDLGQNARRSGE
jgi:hypothetical protein